MYYYHSDERLPPTDVEWLKAKDGVLPAPTLQAMGPGANPSGLEAQHYGLHWSPESHVTIFVPSSLRMPSV